MNAEAADQADCPWRIDPFATEQKTRIFALRDGILGTRSDRPDPQFPRHPRSHLNLDASRI
jgi:hypothetical protein